MGWRRACAVLGAALVCFAGAVAAQDVTLTSRDGAVTVSGTLLGYDGEFYRVETEFGRLTLDGTGVVCSGPGCPSLTAFVAELTVAGDATVTGGLMPGLIAAFASAEGYTISDADGVSVLTEAGTGRIAARIELRTMNADAALAALASGEIDLALARRPILAVDVEGARAAGEDWVSAPPRSSVIALDALVPVASASLPADEIGTDELRAFLAEGAATWPWLEEADPPVRVNLPSEGSATLMLLGGMLDGPIDGKKAAHHDDPDDISRAVLRDPFALGVTTLSALGRAKPLALAGPCGTATPASSASLRAGDYPLAAPLFLHRPPRRLPRVAREFVGFVRSPDAQPPIEEAGFVGAGIEAVPFAQQADRLAKAVIQGGEAAGLAEVQRMTLALRDAARLTVTFRFRDGSADLDAASMSNIEALADEIARGAFDGRELLFAGFSDGQGAADVNLRLSRERARAARQALITRLPETERDRVTLTSDGFGEVSPLACDEVDWGRRINRRVEVWLR